MYFEVTARTNWQFWKLWYFKHLCMYCPWASAVLYWLLLAVFRFCFSSLSDIFYKVASLFLNIFLFSVPPNCSDFSGSCAILQGIYKSEEVYFIPLGMGITFSTHTHIQSTEHNNRNRIHTHRCTQIFSWVIILEAPVCCRANVFFLFFFYGSSIRILISISSLGVCLL